MTHQVRRVRTQAGAHHFDQRIGEVIREKPDREVAKDQWRDAGTQLAIASGSLAVTGILLLRVASGLLATILTLLLLAISMALGVLSLALKNSRAKRTVTRTRRASTRGARRTTRHVVRRRGPTRTATRRRTR